MAEHGIPSDDWLVSGTADPREIAQQYDAWAGQYDADLGAWSYRAPAVVADTVVARRPGPDSVLDIGCGTGMVGRELRARGYEGRLSGLDISQASLRVAEEAGSYDELLAADLQQPLPVVDDAVDALVCVGVMTYLADVEAVWREFARVVRPRGLVVVTQREDLWEPRECRAVVDRLAADGVWAPLEVTGPAPYLPDAGGGLGGLGCYYVVAESR